MYVQLRRLCSGIAMLGIVLFVVSCVQEQPIAVNDNVPAQGSSGGGKKGVGNITATLFENFESSVAKGYANGTQTINGVVWTLNSTAIVVNDAQDKKNGTKCIRMQLGGTPLVSFTKASGGAGTIDMFTGAYNVDAGATLTIKANGVIVGTINVPAGVAGAAPVKSASFAVNQSGSVTFEITQSGGNRVCIDDINVTDGAGMPPAQPTPETENNNSIATAQPISPGAFMSGSLSGTDGQANNDNEDDFKLTGTGSLIVLYVETSSSSAPNMIQITDASGLTYQTRVFVKDNEDGKFKSTIICKVPTNDAMVVRVVRFLASGVSGSYTLRYRRTNGKIFLFDAAHAEDVVNADWVIDQTGAPGSGAGSIVGNFPTPSQTEPNLTASSWKGAYSSLAFALVQQGHAVMTIPPGKSILFNSNGTQDIYLKMCDVLVLPEPNTRYTSAEIKNIRDFVTAGGGLITLADHTVPDAEIDGSIPAGKDYNGQCMVPSDRNNDLWDSPRILNEILKLDMGFRFDLTTVARPGSCTAVQTDINESSNKLATAGPADVNYLLMGKNNASPITAVSMYGGTTMTLSGSGKGIIWNPTGTVGSTLNVRAAISTFGAGAGRIFGYGDTSPFSDGAGGTVVNFDSWNNDGNGNSVSNRNLILNACNWVAKF